MKHLNRLLVAVLLIVGLSANAQTEDNPWAIKVGVNAIDFHPANNSGQKTNLGQESGWFNEFFNVEERWNMPGFGVTVGKYIDKGFSVNAGASFNSIKYYQNSFNSVQSQDAVDWSYLGLDGGVQYSFMDLIGSKRIDPIAGVGGGYSWIDGAGFGTVNGTLGVNYHFKNNTGISLQTTLKHAPEAIDLSVIGGTATIETQGHVSHFMHSISYFINFGGKDTDGDGIDDRWDACLDEPENYNGFLDTDGCPDVEGTTAGDMVDADYDGIPDVDDSCPLERENYNKFEDTDGCPDVLQLMITGDADFDGIL
ncbi:MAG: outer membrane beta-barrel protein, partial [Flavobacteriaceae bacterium]|nr:outer membrane beta-barrel protein [Flavobacteriaceae bacterium]